MTDRMKLLEAVAEAAEALDVAISCGDKLLEWPHRKLQAALSAYRNFPAQPQPQGETVTLGLIRARLSRQWAATEQPEQEDPRDWVLMGNLTFVPPSEPVLPTIPATVTLPLNAEGGA